MICRWDCAWAQLPQRYATNYMVRHVALHDGLPHNFVDDIYRDSQGFVWISLGGAGLARYDGYDFVVYSPASAQRPLASDFAHNTTEDGHRRLWVATSNGLSVIDLNTLAPIDLAEYDKRLADYLDKSILSVYCDSKKKIWICHERGIDCMEFGDDGALEELNTLRFNVLSPSNTHVVRDINQDGNVWSEVDGKICILSPDARGGMHVKPLEIELPIEANVSDILEYEHEIWIATDKGLLRHSRSRLRDKLFLHSSADPYSISQDLITDLEISPTGKLLISTLNGVNAYVPEIEGFLHEHANMPGQRLNSNFVNCMLTDGDKMWVGTETGGINLFTAKVIPTEFMENAPGNPKSLSANPVNAIYEDADGTLWVGVVEGGLNRSSRVEDGFAHFTTANSGLCHNSVSALATDSKQRLWIGTWGGGIDVVDRDNPRNIQIHMLDFPGFGLRPYIGVFMPDAINDGMWIGTSRGLFFYDIATETLHEPFQHAAIDPRGCVGAAIDCDNHLWIGTMNGLIDIDLQSRCNNSWNARALYYKLDAPQSNLREKISYLYYASDSTLWVGSDIHGLYRRRVADGQETFENITTEQGLIQNTVKSIAEDNQGRLWIATDRGLSCYYPDQELFANYSQEHGLACDQFYWNAALRSRSGHLYFGTVKGLVDINPALVKADDTRHEVVFTRLLVDNEPIYDRPEITPYDISISDKVVLHESNKSFSVEFSALDFSGNPSHQYCYMLKGFDKDWISLPDGRHFVTYTNIPPGDYQLMVHYRLRGAAHDMESSVLNIQVKPYFYHTPIFIVLSAIFVVLAVAALFVWRMRRIKEKKEELERAVAERTKEISQQKQMLEERTMRIQELTVERLSFFTNLTHEFRTPITLILGPVKRALQLCKEKGVSEQLGYVERNAKYLLNLVNQLMDFRKIESGKMEIVRKKSNFLDFLDEVVGAFRAAAAERNIEIVEHTHMAKAEICYDKEAVRKLLVNIINNAMKYTPDGGCITIYAALLPQACTQTGTEMLYLCVSDTGDGIDPEDVEHVFDQFFQGKSYLKFPNMQASSGIGLHLCKCIVEAYGGHITVKNNPREGCRFRIAIPVPAIDDEKMAVVAASGPDSADTGDAKPTARMRILLVEDNADMRGFVKSLLAGIYDVAEAENGEEALRLLATTDVDFIICDLMMPVMDGMEFTKKAKENFSTSHIPILMLTAKSSDDTRKESYLCGADDYMAKPFDADMLMTRIENILRNKRRHQRQFSVDYDTSQLDLEETRDKKFLDMVMNVLKENYKNSYFDVGDFAEALGVSRSVLNKKLQSLVGQSSNEFVRNYRLKLAHQMIMLNRQTHALNISEIAYDVGFNDSKYFTRCFTKYFGITPSALLNSTDENISK